MRNEMIFILKVKVFNNSRWYGKKEDEFQHYSSGFKIPEREYDVLVHEKIHLFISDNKNYLAILVYVNLLFYLDRNDIYVQI